jgi:threonylcarbamoyladenosine tRNA methylthiotransferase CDKAL1
MKFYIETYGCTSNMGNSKDLESALINLGHFPTTIEQADITIVNTCAVTEKTERKILKRLHQLQGDRLIIAGCLPAAIPGSVEQISCHKRLGVLNRSAVTEISEFLGKGPSGVTLEKYRIRARSNLDNLCSIINIAEGCPGKCSYCIVRSARGRLVSLDTEEIVERARSIIESGAVELQLTAQDAAAWGLDIGSNLPELLTKITEIPGKFMVRVGMMNPNTAQPILSELAEVFRNPKVYKFIHMPVQSGSDEVLERMRRGYKSQDYIDIVRFLREKLPEPSFATDIIAGFPGESIEDFDKTVKLMELIRPDKINVTRYSSRPRTPAAELYDMPDRFKKDRSRKLTKLWLDIAGQNNRRYIGRAMEVLVTERGRGDSMKARTNNYTGVVIFGAQDLGILQEVRIVGYNSVYLTGETILSGPACIAAAQGSDI